MHQTIFNVVKSDLISMNDKMEQMSNKNSNRQNRTFTIKTKFSVPDVIKKPTLVNDEHMQYSSKI